MYTELQKHIILHTFQRESQVTYNMSSTRGASTKFRKNPRCMQEFGKAADEDQMKIGNCPLY